MLNRRLALDRRLAIAGMALVAAVGLAGCNQASTSDSGGSAPAAETRSTAPADVSAELAAAAAKLSGESFKVDMVMAEGLTATGGFDGKAGDMVMKMTMAGGTGGGGEIEMRKVGKDLYVKFGEAMAGALGADGDKWMHIDSSKVPAGSSFSPETNDPKNAAKLLETATTVQKTGEGAYSGVLDITKSPTATDAVKALGEKAKAVPFTAKTDAEGRLTEMNVDMSTIAAGAGKLVTKYSDFGTEVSVQKPAASDVVEMPKSVERILTA